MDYLKYFLPFGVLTLTGIGLEGGGLWTWLGLGLFAVMAVPDIVMDFDYADRRMSEHGALFMLWIQLLPTVFLWVAFWRLLQDRPDFMSLLGGIVSTSIITAACALPVAHELFHRPRPVSRFAGAVMTTLMLFNYIELEHNKSHHIETSSVLDVDTPRRGEALYPFMVKLWLFLHYGSYLQEKRRLAVYGESVWTSPRSRMLWNLFGSAAVLAVFYMADGWRSLLAALVTCLVGGLIVTVFSYVQHYGLIRVPGSPIEKRHAWNHTRPVSRMLTFEIVTHSQHHMNPMTPYWLLPAYRDAPLVGSAIGYFFLSLVPPLWHRVMRGHLACWDRQFATPAELRLAREANRAAGWETAGPDVRTAGAG